MQSLELRSDATQGQLELLLDMLAETESVPGDIAEVGSWRCGTSGLMAYRYPKRTIYAFDLFGGYPYGKERSLTWVEEGDRWDEVQQVAKQFPNLIPVRGKHEQTIPEFARRGRPLSLIFMDSDHYESHCVALEYLCPLLSSGGVLIFHDFEFTEVRVAIQQNINHDDYKILDGRDAHGMGVLRKN
jgi:O-methyltransferase